MGIHGMSSNIKRAKTRTQAYRKGRQHMCKKHKRKPRIVGEVPDLTIAPQSVRTQRRKNSRTNVEMSGKKKRKITKQIKRLHPGKKAKDVEMEDLSKPSGSKQKKKQPKIKDVDMEEEQDKQEEHNEESLQEEESEEDDMDV